MNFFERWFPSAYSNVRNVLGFSTLNASTQFNQYVKDKEKLAAVLSNPAALKVFALQCDMFSLGQIYVYKDGEEVKDDPFLSLVRSPNPLQSGSQWLWDFMFWTMLGNSYNYVNSSVVDTPLNRMYFLDPSKIEWPPEMQKYADKLIFSDDLLKSYKKQTIIYRYDDGTTFTFPLDRLVITSDLTNGVGNWFRGPSRFNALYKIVSNSEASLDSKNINVRWSGKFLVGSNNDTAKMGLTDDEKADITDKFLESGKNVYPLKTMIDIKRFVTDMAALQLDESYLADYFLIGSMYNIPRDVLEANVSSTFENQEKARMAHVSYTLQPKGNDFMNSLERFFGYDKQGKNILIDWGHLLFVQVFKKDEAAIETIKINSLNLLLNMQVPLEDANRYLDLDFKTAMGYEAKAEVKPGGNQGA